MLKSLLHRPKRIRGSANVASHSDHSGSLTASSTQQPDTQCAVPSNNAATPSTDEYGIKVLYSPARPTVDIVFVHGSTGSQLSTWTATGAADPWPKLFLANDLPDARISAFGYDADVVNLLGPAGQNRIRHHAANLIRGVAEMWLKNEIAELPIIFVAHSLGGLVCENALTIAEHAQVYEKQILEYTRAIAFLGTPHRGFDLAGWGTIVGNMANLVKKTNTDVIKLLQPVSEILANVTQDFDTMLRSREQAHRTSIQITCFVEELPVTKAGKSFMVVPSKSATLEGYPYMTIHADHISMTKFKGRDKGYKSVYLELKRWIKQVDRPLQDSDSLDVAQVTMSLSWQSLGGFAGALVYGVEEPDFPHFDDTPLTSRGVLGFGGQAVVERVTMESMGLTAARKTFMVHSDKDLKAIHAEACTELHHMKKLSPHHHITTPVLAYNHDDKYHIVMTPVADGGSLASFHKKVRLNPENMTFKDYKTLQHCFGCLTMTMTHIHEACIRYKDVKLENILVHKGELIFSDFGVAYDFSLSPDGRSTTEGYAGAQTWTYSAPEVHSDGCRNRKSDMFSLGVVLYKILSLFELQLAELETQGFYSHKIEEMIDKVEQVMSQDGNLIFPIAVYKVIIAMLTRDQTARISSTDALNMLMSHPELFCNQCRLSIGGIERVRFYVAD